MQALNYTGAFATVKPVERDLAQDLIDNDLKYKQDRRLEEAHEENKAKLKDDKIKDTAKYQGKFNPYDTGSATYNTVIANALGEAKTKALEFYKVANDRSKSDQERMEAQANLNDLENYPTYLKNISDRVTEVNSAYVDAVKKGNAWDNPDWNKKFQNQYNGMRITMGPDLKPGIVFFDKDGDGTEEQMTHEEILSLTPENIIIPKVNMFKTAETYAKGLEASVNKEYDPNNPYKTTKTTGVSFEELEAGAEQIMTPEALNSWKYERGIKGDLTPEQTKQIKIDLIESMMPYTKRGVETEFDIKAKNADENADAQRALTASEGAANRKSRESEGDKNRAVKLATSKSGKGSGTTPVSISEIALSGRTKEGNSSVPKGTLNFGAGGGLSLNPTPGEYHIIDKVRLTPSGNLLLEGYIDYKDTKGNALKPRKKIFLNSSKDEAEMTKYSTNFQNEDGENFSSTTEFLKAIKAKVDGKNIVPVGKSEKTTSDLSKKTYKGVDDNGNPIWE